ncbi:CocE/NonD family hydrolase [Amycolatopsis sp. cmx-11-12]|uniref:CocE/NonD family hydrolase n=1 Tax=Amycolatopsis sp. cmx-11-12 TaxID=2785795 RepID=UPI0039181314
MTIVSRAYALLAGLSPATSRRVGVERGIAIPMPDGVVLRADRWFPDEAGGDRAPILLAMSPYGRSDVKVPYGRLGAERGYQALIVSARGSFGSGGQWVPFRDAQADGAAVLDWLSEQPWFSGRVGTVGGSYLGFTQWAVAKEPPSWLQAMAPAVTTGNMQRMAYPSAGAFALESALTWLGGLEHQERPLPQAVMHAVHTMRGVRAAADRLPLFEVDLAMVGRQVPWFQDWLVHDTQDDHWWVEIDGSRAVETTPPASMVAGWYDLFLAAQLDDFRRLKAAGRCVRLTVGPWTHNSPGNGAAGLRDTFDWMGEHLRGTRSARSASSRVRVFVLGARCWVDLPDWPPTAETTHWHLHPDGRLSTEPPPESAPDRYRYDPADPTPSVGGPSLNAATGGCKDNRRLEARPDVLTYTTGSLAEDLTVIGDVTAELYVRSSLEHTDFFVRLCDVAPSGRSSNLCDGIVRLTPKSVEKRGDGSLRVRVRLFPTANTFLRGHRIRLQVSSGAHPLYARNTGSGEPLGKATTLVAADQEVFHDPARASRIELPVVSAVGPVRGHHRRFRAEGRS